MKDKNEVREVYSKSLSVLDTVDQINRKLLVEGWSLFSALVVSKDLIDVGFRRDYDVTPEKISKYLGNTISLNDVCRFSLLFDDKQGNSIDVDVYDLRFWRKPRMMGRIYVHPLYTIPKDSLYYNPSYKTLSKISVTSGLQTVNEIVKTLENADREKIKLENSFQKRFKYIQ